MNRFGLNAFIVLLAGIFGANYVIGKYLLGYLDPRVVALVRVLAAVVVFLPLGFYFRPRQKVPKKDWVVLFLSSFLGITLNQLLFMIGLEKTTASHSAIINAGVPVYTLIVAILFRVEQPSILRFLGFVISFAGILYLLGFDRNFFDQTTWLGDLITCAQVLSFSIYLVVFRNLSTKYKPFWLMLWLFLFGLIFIGPIGVQAFDVESFRALSASAWLSLIFVMFVHTVVGYFLLTWLLGLTTSSHVSQNVYLQPVFALFMAYLWLDEALSPRLILATILVLLGIAVSQFRAKPTNALHSKS